MKRTIVFILLLAMISPLVSGQDVGVPDWDIGWDSDDEPMIMELDSNYNFELVIKFWVDNSRPLPADIDFEVESNEQFIVDDPGKITVSANSNETFELTISGTGWDGNGALLDARGSHYDIITLKAILLFGEQNAGEKEIEKQVQFSPVFGFEISFEPPNQFMPTIKSGTNEQITIFVDNVGNVDDALTKIDMKFKGCPQMNFEQIDMLKTGEAIAFTMIGTSKLLAPSSHPDKICTFVVTVTSEGNGISYAGELEFDVDAPDISEEEDKEESPNPESSDLEVEGNTLPAISSFLCLLTVCFAAVIRR
jgi:hypothetical protein